ncbi:MAG: sulfatase-like hydrolase/transferase [Pseudomonadota bacterium]
MAEQNNLNNPKEQFLSKGFVVVVFALLLLVTLGYFEYYIDNQNFFGPLKLAWLIQKNSTMSITWKIGVMAFFGMLLLSGRPAFSAIATFFIFGLIVAGSLNKIHYLGVPLTIADLYFFFGDLKENSILFFNYPLLGLLIASSALFIIAISYWFMRSEKRRNLNKNKLALFSICILSVAYGSDEVRISKNNYFSLDENQVNQEAGKALNRNLVQENHQNSIFDLVEIFFTRRSTNFDVPKKVENALFEETSDNNRKTIKNYRPDVISVLNESLFNPKILSACDTTELCNFEIFGENKKYPGIYGPLFVHTHGGGTWLSEFAFLSGYDWRVFGEGGAYAPRSIVPHLQSSLASHFKQLGYRTIAVYPVAGNFLNAREAYKSYGFDEFYATEDLGITTDWQSTSDSAIFKKSIELIDKNQDGKPIFLFILTIKNHGPHAEKFDSIKNAHPDFLNNASSLPASLVDFINRLKETNDAIISLRNNWLNSEKPRIFLWFGDHQPMFSKTMKNSEKFLTEPLNSFSSTLNIRFLTWYEITSNLINREISKHPAPTDLAFLGTKLLQYSGLPLQGHGKATLQLSELCPLGIARCNDEKLINEYLSFRIWDLKEIQLPH